MKGFAAQTDRYVGMDLTDPAVDYVGLARSLGVKSARASALDEVVARLREALAQREPFLIDIELDRSYTPV
jgi:benzoylformate decarboxylase